MKSEEGGRGEEGTEGEGGERRGERGRAVNGLQKKRHSYTSNLSSHQP